MTDIMQTPSDFTDSPKTNSSESLLGNKVMIWGVFLLIATGIFIMWSWPGASSSMGSSEITLPVLATVPDFLLDSHTGQTVGLTDLLGHVWVADFIFTTCAGPCPMLTLRMRSLQSALIKSKRDVKLISISVDPETDRPGVLKRYATKNQADPNYWWFLTGDSEAEVHELIQKGFLQAITPSAQDRPIIHSTRFMLIDAQGRIRAYYDGLDPGTKKRILQDIDVLLGEINDS